MEYLYEHEIEIKLNKIKELRERLSIIDICNPTRKAKVMKRLYEKQLKSAEDELKKELNVSELPPMSW